MPCGYLYHMCENVPVIKPLRALIKGLRFDSQWYNKGKMLSRQVFKAI